MNIIIMVNLLAYFGLYLQKIIIKQAIYFVISPNK